MSGFLKGLFDRMSDPGSIRSLVLAIFMFKGLAIDDGTADAIANGVIGIIAAGSFFMKPKAVVAVVPATQVTEAASDIQDAASKLQGVLGTTR